ncbi:hypothetical protein ACFSCX_23445 [Bacillus salitolerans]|uniref:Uncharacterized protein n=1 Tax=Bacillus salitolerans TaxID=1437434 RepID=A0ABW4LWB1_9BACI
MRLKNGDYYTNVHSNKQYKLNEDNNSNWYLSVDDKEGYQETERLSGRDMIRLVNADYTKSYSTSVR